MPPTPLHIGLTGGIGSGKSTVAARLVDLGAVLVDTDGIARQLTAPGGGALAALSALFGPHIIGADGALDRDHMRQLAFGDPQVRQRLEGVLHPMIGAQALREAAAAGTRPVVFDVPLLTESVHWRRRVARVLVVDCSEASQIERVQRRSGLAADAVQRIIDQQASRSRRRAIADAVIHNDGLSLSQLHAEVDAIWGYWNSGTV
jgi:dephospho-CoA kinase